MGCGQAEIAPSGLAERPLTTPISTHSPTSTSTTTFTATPTNAPIPSNTPTQTATSTVTPSPTVTPPSTIVTKTVFLQYGGTGGDGISNTDVYYGVGMPNLVIYTDGQVILGEGDWQERYFRETAISPNEMCHLLDQLQDLGFFETYDPIYAFDETTEYSDGVGSDIIHINGPLSKRLAFYRLYKDYLIPPLKQSAEFVTQYRPSTNTYYMPDRVVLWVETATGSQPENTAVRLWPDTFPPITELWQDPINGEVLVEGDLVAPMMELFDYRMSGEWFSDEGAVYHVILRPLLPNESPYPQLWHYHDYDLESFNLPFDCPNMELPIIDSTRAP